MSVPPTATHHQLTTFQGKLILEIDFARCDSKEIRARIPAIQAFIRSQPKASLLTLSDFTDSRYDWDTTQALKAYSAANREYVRRAAVLGVNALKRHILDSINLFTKREIKAFDDPFLAKLWLVRP